MAFALWSSYRTLRWAAGRTERRLGRVACACAYILPIALRDGAACALAVGGFGATAILFAWNARLNGWGHALSHLTLVPLAVGVLRGAAAVQAPGAEMAAAALRPLQAALVCRSA